MIVSSPNLRVKDFETEKAIRTRCVKGSATTPVTFAPLSQPSPRLQLEEMAAPLLT